MAKSVLQDPFLAQNLPWKYIDDLLIMDLLHPQPRRNLHENGVLDIDAIDETTFYRNFRFHKGDLDDLIVGLLIPGEVMSAQRVRVSDREALCMTLRRLAYPNRLCDLETIFNRHSSVISSVVSKVMSHIEYYFGHLLADLTVHGWLNLQNLQLFTDFAFVDFHKNLRVTGQRVGRMYKVATLLTNCRTCLYDSQVSIVVPQTCSLFGSTSHKIEPRFDELSAPSQRRLPCRRTVQFRG
ncbi:hypothetical protein HPB51_007957 [Rhipicephalus microplus]|uniref:Uncharacterized protein n=1 Tax=Rhipicephalus microplus TaxID=6941 RepID=A0A9J6DTJ6_RHIMP|nr:hypothetical protein HPB51_007957 [Rhipicephalus microplus]